MEKYESPRQAIGKYCKGCCYDSAEPGTWRLQVNNCTITHCELYKYRPVKRLNRQESMTANDMHIPLSIGKNSPTHAILN